MGVLSIVVIRYKFSNILIGCPAIFDRKAGHVPISTLKKDRQKCIVDEAKIMINLWKSQKIILRKQGILDPKRYMGHLLNDLT